MAVLQEGKLWGGQRFRCKLTIISKEGEFEEDPSVVCINQVEETCCAISVSLRGRTKDVWGKYESVYESTNLLSMGRKVGADYQQSLKSLL